MFQRVADENAENGPGKTVDDTFPGIHPSDIRRGARGETMDHIIAVDVTDALEICAFPCSCHDFARIGRFNCYPRADDAKGSSVR